MTASQASNPLALIVEDDDATRTSLAELVRRLSFDVTTAATLTEARESLARRKPTVVLSDLVLPDGSGLDLLDELAGPPPVDLVFITGQPSVDTVISALRAGARDFLTKPIDVERLKQILRDVAKTREALATGGAQTLEQAERTGTFGHIVGRSPPMLKLFREVQRVANTEATVLLQGETGTGKELVASTIHEMSDRRDGAFVPLNCGAVSGTLIESELFGHEQGSFTGATRRHVGVFERAHEGTLFLDEITEMPLELQVKLLRVLETRSFTRVGGEKPIESAARLIAATNRAPEEAVRAGKLREDLFYRLRVFPISLPPLNRRGDDVTLLANRFLEELNSAQSSEKTFAPEALAWLKQQPWPGNVRELRNVVQRAYIMSDSVIDVACLEVRDDSVKAASPSADAIVVTVGSTIAEAERLLILATLERFDGDKHRAASVLGISVKTLYARLSVYNATR